MTEWIVGDRVKRKRGHIPENQLGAIRMSIDTLYKIIWISPKGLCVLEDYLMLVDPAYLEGKQDE